MVDLTAEACPASVHMALSAESLHFFRFLRYKISCLLSRLRNNPRIPTTKMSDEFECHFCSLKTTDTTRMVSHVKEAHFQVGDKDYDLPSTSTMKIGLKVKPIESLQLRGKGGRKVKYGAKNLKPVPATELAKLKLKPVTFEEVQRRTQKVHKTNPDRGETTEESGRKRTFEETEETNEGRRPGQHKSKARKTDRPHQCKECPYKADQMSNLQLHVIQAHEKPRLYQCQQCSYKAPRFCDLQQHMSKSPCRFAQMSAPQEDPNDTTFMFDFVRLDSLQRLRGAAPEKSGSRKLRLKTVPADELAKLKLKPVSENQMERNMLEQKQEFIEPKRIFTREKHINELLAKQASNTDLLQYRSRTRSQINANLMTRHIKNESEHFDSAENVSRYENDSRDNSREKEYEEQKNDIGAMETVLEAEPLTFMKQEVEDLVHDQGGAKMKLRCNACGLKAADMVEMTGHLISKHVDEL